MDHVTWLQVKESESMGETYQPFVIIEAAYMAWFTLEFFVRLVSSPSKVICHPWASRLTRPILS